MICEEARLHFGAEPSTVSDELRAHLEGCGECTQYQREMLALDSRLRSALTLGPLLPAPARAPAAAAPPRARPRVRIWAMAASVLTALIGGAFLWSALTPDTLARDVSVHLTHEPDSWHAPQAVPEEFVNAVLAPDHVALVAHQDRVIFARRCMVEHRWVPHLVVRTDQGPVTVVILPGLHPKSSRVFHENGFTGVLLPAPRGSIAVLTQNEALTTAVVQQMNGAVRWLPDPTAAQ